MILNKQKYVHSMKKHIDKIEINLILMIEIWNKKINVFCHECNATGEIFSLMTSCHNRICIFFNNNSQESQNIWASKGKYQTANIQYNKKILTLGEHKQKG